MNQIVELKNILDTIDLKENQKKRISELINTISVDIEELNFRTTRFQRDQKVNENFVKKTVELLEKSNEKLKESNNTLLETNHKLINSNIELERFAHIASHDLKTPLYTIIRISGLLKNFIESNNNALALENLSFIIESGKKMNNLIEDILEYSKLSKKNNDDKQIINIKELINDILLSTSEYLKQKNAKVEILTPLPYINWHKLKLVILFKNLIENGIKYNISISPNVKIYAKQEQLKYSIFIEDNGIGIEKQYFDRIFEMFSRLHSHSEYDGTGLGLALCKKIVEEFDGEIKIESQVNSKTIFKIEFPLQMIELENEVQTK